MHIAAPEMDRMGVLFSYIHNLDISEYNQVKPYRASLVPNWQNIFGRKGVEERVYKIL